MSKQKKRHIFNLLKPVEPPKTVWDKIYDWILTRAKIVMMLAEVFIAIAFFSKVIVDTQAKSKIETINSFTAQARLYVDENGVANARLSRYSEIQARSSDYVKLWNGSSNLATVLEEIYSYIPNQVADVNVSIQANRLMISGQIELDTLRSIENLIDNSPTFVDSEITLIIEEDDSLAGLGSYSLEATISEDFLTRQDI
ncbi:MAG: hypothetical protein KatS3mg085_184 [Candidatus Dojkabacteria bacterium]|nr:MAG: hypothetical protein KatS3mg085_184 [Candidatus Dojkabacteria bacterium]